MKNSTTIVIWDGCDAAVMEAIEQFQNRWRPYSASSRRYPVVGLIEEVIDPAVAAYSAKLPQRYLGHIPGAGTGVSFSTIIRLVGLDAMVRVQRLLLSQFTKTEDKQTTRDQRYVATLESLVELVWACACKRPVKSPLRDSIGKSRELNGTRPQTLCRFCGVPTELASFAGDESQWRGKMEDDKLLLSNLYCLDHRPKLQNGVWNPAYRQAKRSQAQFDLELGRINRQCAKRSAPHAATSGDQLVDSYFFHYFSGQTLQPADKADLRNLARLMVDSKLSDTRKKILVLLHSGFNQSEIAEQLLSKDGRALTRQAVSKALASIPAMFHLKKKRKRTVR